MIGMMEKTCRDLVLPYLEPGYDTVGTHVDVYHLAAAYLGAPVTFVASVLDVNGRRVRFRVETTSEGERIGEGTHERTVINVARFAAKRAEKRQPSGGKP
jgi:predicted thioesterase